MAHAKFASITAGLLARKGDARPWTDEAAAKMPPSWEAAGDAPSPPIALCDPRSANDDGGKPDGMHKLTLRISRADYERLGLIAAKRDVTRQHLMRAVLDEFLAAKAAEYGACCACIGGACGGCGPSD